MTVHFGVMYEEKCYQALIVCSITLGKGEVPVWLPLLSNANLLYLAHAESIQGWLLQCCMFMCLVITQGLLFCLTLHIQYFP